MVLFCGDMNRVTRLSEPLIAIVGGWAYRDELIGVSLDKINKKRAEKPSSED